MAAEMKKTMTIIFNEITIPVEADDTVENVVKKYYSAFFNAS
jgi:hypothetical protein